MINGKALLDDHQIGSILFHGREGRGGPHKVSQSSHSNGQIVRENSHHSSWELLAEVDLYPRLGGHREYQGLLPYKFNRDVIIGIFVCRRGLKDQIKSK